MEKEIKLQDLRKEMKNVKGTFFLCVNTLFAYAEICPQLKKILPQSKNKAKTEEHEIECKKFVKFGETLTRKVSKMVDGVRCTTEITYIKNNITLDECLKYFLQVYNNK